MRSRQERERLILDELNKDITGAACQTGCYIIMAAVQFAIVCAAIMYFVMRLN